MNSIIDRISRNAKHIKEAADANSSVGPFTRALLSTDLGDLIRDIHPSELGLFTLQNDQEPQVVRVQFHGATPLRKQPIIRDEGHKSKEYHPEIYAQAALSYIERFESIRRMPRAYSQVLAILDRLNLVRENIQILQQTLQQVQAADGPSLKSQTDSEEARINNLQAQIAKLNERKARIAEQTEATEEPESSSLPLTPMRGLADDGEWNSPGAPARTLHFTDSLLINESVDLGDTSMISMSASPTSGRTIREGGSTPDQVEDDTIVPTEDPSTPPSGLPVIHSSPKISVMSTPKLKINAEVERIAAKIWASIGDLIKPGHGYDLSGPGNKPPRAKETIEYLQSVAALTPLPQSPTYSSTNTSQSTASPSCPSAQQILIAQLLVSLLSSPHLAMPLNDIKTILAQKLGSEPNLNLVGVLGGPQGATKVLYVCVAKRLVTIDRSGGKQVVKFDL